MKGKTMTTYLVPLDGSPLSEKALPWAKMLAGEQGNLRLLRCINSPSSPNLEANLRAGEEYLGQLCETHGLSRVECSVKQGKPAETILSESQADVDAIVLSSHGAGGVGRWLIGSVASKVLKGSVKPVYVVRAGQHDLPTKLTKIVLCLDGSPLAERALEPATQLARRFNAELKLIQVNNPQASSAAELKTVLDSSDAYLQKQAARFPDHKIETSVRASGILEGILKESSGYDLTVVTSHGQGGFQRWLLGSLTEKLLHLGQTTLLIVPAG